MTTTLEEFIEKWDRKHGIDPGAAITAHEILRVAEEWCKEPPYHLPTNRGPDTAGHQSYANDLLDFLKSYITRPSTSEEKK